ncbi:MAG: hypothetical protein ACI8X3_001356 [Saprospiraceae bacterium]|jgi:hypothetical protein
MNLVITTYAILSIIFGVVFLIWKREKFFISNNFLLAILALGLLIYSFVEVSIAFYSGYLYELIAFYNSIPGNSFLFFKILGTLSLLLALLNFKRKFRRMIPFSLLLLIIFVIQISRGEYKGIGSFELNRSTVDSGWHTTIGGVDYINSILFFLLLLLLNALVVYFKLLPEFKQIHK